MKEIPIKHVASFARAGETMTLRMLASHPRIHVPLQIQQAEDVVDQKFVARVVDQELQSISVDDPYARARGLIPGSVVVVKQGVWAPRAFDGIVLVRQPFAFVASMLECDRQEGLPNGHGQRLVFARTYERLLRWSERMDQALCARINATDDVVDALGVYYRWRVSWLTKRGLPIFRYELVVKEPKKSSEAMCQALGVEFDDAILDSHNHHRGKVGHGKNDLERPIDASSLDKWRALDLSVRRRILRTCSGAAFQAGYRLYEDEVLLI